MAIQALTGLTAAPAPAPAPAATRSPQPAQADVVGAEAVAARSAAVAETIGVDTGRLRQAVESINRQLIESSKNVRFSIDEDTGDVIVRVVDSETDQVIRQIPSEEAIAISQSIERLQGLLLHQKA